MVVSKLILIVLAIFASIGFTEIILEFFQAIHWRTCSHCGDLIDIKNDNYCKNCGAEIIKEDNNYEN